MLLLQTQRPETAFASRASIAKVAATLCPIVDAAIYIHAEVVATWTQMEVVATINRLMDAAIYILRMAAAASTTVAVATLTKGRAVFVSLCDGKCGALGFCVTFVLDKGLAMPSQPSQEL